MEKFEKILELLEKDNLSEIEMKLLHQYSESDSEIKSFVKVYRNLESSLSKGEHIPADLLASYIMYEAGDESEDKIIQILNRKVSVHLKECSECKKEYEELKSEYSAITDHVSKSISQKPESKQSGIFVNSVLKRTGAFKYAFAVIAVIMVTYVGLFVVSSSITPDYKKNLFQNEFENSNLTRGRTSSLFQQGMNAIDKKEYPKAIEFLKQDITEHQNEKSIFYSNYILGLTYLKISETDFLGLFKSYSSENVDLAISNFQIALEKNNSGSYENLKLDTYYYLGRSYLLIDDNESAISNFNKVIEGKGRFAAEAQKIISGLEKN
jgi:tetratricopeptide (TPR) repeat protein